MIGSSVASKVNFLVSITAAILAVSGSLTLLGFQQAHADSISTTITSSKFNQPFDITYDSSNGKFYVVNGVSASVVVVDPSHNNATQSIGVANLPCDTERIVYDSSNENLYVTVSGCGNASNGVYVIDGNATSPNQNTVIAGPIGVDAVGITYDSIHAHIFVTGSGTPGTFSVIDGKSG